MTNDMLAERVAQRSTNPSSYFDEENFEKLYYNKLKRWIKRLNKKNETSED